VSVVLADQSKRPREYVREYDKFMYLIDGRAEQVKQILFVLYLLLRSHLTNMNYQVNTFSKPDLRARRSVSLHNNNNNLVQYRLKQC